MVIVICYFKEIDMQVIVVDSIIKEQNARHACRYNNTYFFYSSDQGIYRAIDGKEPELISQINGVTAMAANSEFLFVAAEEESSDTLIKLTHTGRIILSNEVPFTINSMYAGDENLYVEYTALTDIFDLNNLTRKEAASEGVLNQQIRAYNRQEYVVNKMQDVLLVEQSGYDTDLKQIISYTGRGNIFLALSGNKLLRFDDLDLITYDKGYIYNLKYDKQSNNIQITSENKQTTYRIQLPKGTYVKSTNCAVYNSKLIIVGQNNGTNKDREAFTSIVYKLFTGKYLKSLGGGHRLPLDDVLGNHRADYVYIYDTNTHQVCGKYQTHKGERVLYANEKKFLTYYKGRLLTYSIKDGAVVAEEKIKELDRNSTYYFELCNEKLFVYDKRCKLLKIISLSEYQ